MKKTIYLLVGLTVAGLASAGCRDKKKSESGAEGAPAGTGSAAAVSTVQKGTGSKDVKETVGQLPAVDESFHAAKEAGMLEAWQRTAPFKPRKLEGMKQGETAIEVGKVLVDIAVVTADTKKRISPEVIQQIADCMKAIQPPAAMQKEITQAVEDIKKGGKDEEVRAKMAKLIVSSLPAIEEDPALASSAGLAMVGGYLRTLGVTSKVLAAGTAGDQDKLDLLHRQQENAFFIDLMSTKLDASVKGEPAVKEALEALQKISPNVAKAKPTLEDARAIAAALAKYAT